MASGCGLPLTHVYIYFTGLRPLPSLLKNPMSFLNIRLHIQAALYVMNRSGLLHALLTVLLLQMLLPAPTNASFTHLQGWFPNIEVEQR